MGIKAPAMIQRPAREQLQWPAQEARIKVVRVYFILFVSHLLFYFRVLFLDYLQQTTPWC
jgi:hypothetical protein